QEQPVLFKPLPTSGDLRVQSLTATQIADLGSAQYADSRESRAYFTERWRRGVLQDAPTRIDAAQGDRVVKAKVGEIVHRALRLTLPDNDHDLRDLLHRYAWEEGIVEEVQNRRTVRDAYDLLQRVRRSDVFAWVEGAGGVYRELPFVYQTERRTIHG